MKIIINTTNLKGGGAVQVAVSFIYEAIKFTSNEYHVFLSPVMIKEIKKELFPDNFIFYNFENPSRFILFDKTISLLNKVESEIKPDCVFSVFGPTYWKPKSKHVVGFANALYLYEDLPYMQNMKTIKKIKFMLLKLYHQYLLKKNADLYVVQTGDMKDRFSKFVNQKSSNIKVVSSKYHSIFEDEIKDLNLLPSRAESEFRFITISAYYPHKKLDMINELVELIKVKDLNIKFVLTLPEKVLETNFKYSRDYIINLGPVKLEECPYIYSSCDALFLPTLVESFTASYPEAMKMKKPILTSDYTFATSVCHNAALYFNPYDIDDVMEKIEQIYFNKDLYSTLVENGLEVVEKLPSAENRAENYLNICKEAIKQ
ncbi:MAG: glycosyltransferase [Campylobacterota bacterium]|nr:glycosyltransferase [Campylobacterota bacterium]